MNHPWCCHKDIKFTNTAKATAKLRWKCLHDIVHSKFKRTAGIDEHVRDLPVSFPASFVVCGEKQIQVMVKTRVCTFHAVKIILRCERPQGYKRPRRTFNFDILISDTFMKRGMDTLNEAIFLKHARSSLFTQEMIYTFSSI